MVSCEALRIRLGISDLLAGQGRVVMAAWFLLFIGGTIMLRPDRYPIAYAAYELLVTALLVLVIVAKGEKPRWRWGDDSDRKSGL